MGKKKTSEKLKHFYRGPAIKPCYQANEEDMKIISMALTDCLENRKKDFCIESCFEHLSNIHPVIGLSASLRSIKQGRVKAIIYDETAANHLSNYLNYFANKSNIPIIKATKMTHDIAPRFKLRTLLTVSFMESSNDRIIIPSEPLSELFKLFARISSPENKLVFKMPVLDALVCSDKSKIKKKLKRDSKRKKLKVEDMST